VKASHCDSCMVPPDQLNELRKAVDPGWPARTEADMKKVIHEMHDIRKDAAVYKGGGEGVGGRARCAPSDGENKMSTPWRTSYILRLKNG
jgi:hypothetical protein